MRLLLSACAKHATANSGQFVRYGRAFATTALRRNFPALRKPGAVENETVTRRRRDRRRQAWPELARCGLWGFECAEARVTSVLAAHIRNFVFRLKRAVCSWTI